MKNLLLAFIFCLPIFASAQRPTIDSITKKVTYSDVVSIVSSNKDQLYNNAKIWFINNFKSANDVIQLDDKQAGHIIGKGLTQLPDSRLWFTVDLQLKDGRYKYTLTNFYVTPLQPGQQYTLEYLISLPGNNNSDGTFKPRFKRFIEPAIQAIQDNVNSLKQAMSLKSPTDF